MTQIQQTSFFSFHSAYLSSCNGFGHFPGLNFVGFHNLEKETVLIKYVDLLHTYIWERVHSIMMTNSRIFTQEVLELKYMDILYPNIFKYICNLKNLFSQVQRLQMCNSDPYIPPKFSIASCHKSPLLMMVFN